MFKNQHNFFSWQGNNLSWHGYYQWIALGIVLITLLVLWVFRFRIARYWEKKTKWLFVFNKEKHFWIFIGSIVVLIQVIRLIFFITYVNRWELLSLHLCRLHITLMGVILMINKPDKIKFFGIMAFVGMVFAFFFGKLQSDTDLSHYNPSDYSTLPSTMSLDEKLMVKHGFTFYNVGPDNFFFWEYFFAHMFIGIVPAFIWIARKNTFTLKEFLWMKVMYVIMVACAWTFDWASSYIQDERWHANLWFIGTNSENDMKAALGWLSAWPQNLITYGIFLGFTVTWMFYLFIFFFGNVKWFEDGKVFQFKRSKEWLNFKADFRRIVLRKK